MAKYYVTTPIYYINDVPHIGHAYTTIAADVLARYHRKIGDDVFFLTGTDEHGAKIAEAAKAAGKSPQEFVDSLEPKFKEAWKNLNISYDQFFRTTNPKHETLVQGFVKNLADNGFVEKRSYEGLYCIACEKFLKETELVDGCCPDHKKPPVKQKEENYFFKLSAVSSQLLAVIESGEFEIGPETRKNEVVGKIKQGLEDISISRAAVEWGVKFPGDESQTIYVWIDALLNYYTATKLFDKEVTSPNLSFRDQKGEGPSWPANLHLMAKDILWFHAVIWPAMLLAADLPLPRKVFAHGFFTVNGQKMSKTIGNVIDPNQLVEKFGADAVRYALLREFPLGEDGDISEEKVASQYNKLANNIGNLLQRTLSMINKYEVEVKSQKSKVKSNELTINKEIERLDFMGALRKIDEKAEGLNSLIAEKQPWVLAKEGKYDELNEVLKNSCIGLSEIAESIEPFMPETAQKMKKQLETLVPEPLFPRIEE